MSDAAVDKSGSREIGDMDEITPKPLKYRKTPLLSSNAGSKKVPVSGNNEDSLALRTLSSTSRLRQLGLLTHENLRPSSSPRDENHLSVRKRRQHDKLRESSATADNHVRYLPTRSNDQGNGQSSGFYCKPVLVGSNTSAGPPNQLGSTTMRSHSTGYVASKSLRPDVDRMIPKSVDGNQPGASRRRALTSVEPLPIFGLRTHERDNSVSRRSSLKERVISRVVSSVTGRKRSQSQLPATGLAQPGLRNSIDQANDQRDSREVSRQSFCSSYTGSCVGVDLTNALAAFPTPPTPTLTPPTSTDGSFKSSVSHQRTARDLCTPLDVGALAAEFTLTPEFDHARFETCDSMFVSIDVKATVPSLESVRDDTAAQNFLDVVIVVDNLVHSSPGSLVSMCETTGFIASNLNSDTDRLAVVTFGNSREGGCPVVVPLSRPRIQTLKDLLDGITISSDTPESTTKIDALNHAQRVITDSPRKGCNGREGSRTFGHIVVLTTSTMGPLDAFKLDDRLTLHLVCPGVLPQAFGNWPCTNGWKLRTMTGQDLQAGSRTKKAQDADELASGLKRLISQARSGHKLGILTIKDLSFDPGPDTTIEEVLGEPEKDKTLQPGEVHTVIVKIRCKRPEVAVRAWYGTAPDSDSNAQLFAELERMLLGSSVTPILYAQTTYRHPLLPKFTVCCSMKPCVIKRFIAAPGEIIPRTGSALESKQRMLVHQRLSYHYFTQLSSQEAMSALQEVIGEGGGRMACPSYVSLLMQEQQYQKRLNRRVSWLDLPDTPRHSIESGGSRVSLDGDPDSSSGEQAPLTKRVSSAPTPGSNSYRSPGKKRDAARRIWSDMRLRSKPPGSQETIVPANRDIAGKSVDAVQRTALRNKRSIGNDTLRSLSLPVQNSNGIVAPWL